LSKEISFNSLKLIDFLNKQKCENISSQSLCVTFILKKIIKDYSIENFFKELLNLDKMNTHDLISKINEIILYCHNVCYHYNEDKNKNNNKDNIENIKDNNNGNNIENNSENNNENNNEKNNEKNNENNDKNNNNDKSQNIIISSPYIKNELTKKFCLVLDLDGTLVWRKIYKFEEYFFVRPGMFNLFKELSENYEINIFTASGKDFADFVIDKLDKDNKYISYRFYGYHCCEDFFDKYKRLDKIGRDLKKAVTIDDQERVASYNKNNLIHISMWLSDIFDDELFYITNKLKLIALSSKYDKDITLGLKEINNYLNSKREMKKKLC